MLENGALGCRVFAACRTLLPTFASIISTYYDRCGQFTCFAKTIILIMEQVNYLRRTLAIKSIDYMHPRSGLVIDSATIISLTALACFIGVLANYFRLLTYGFVGLVMPLFCTAKQLKVNHYWPCYAVLLFLRMFTSCLAFLDVRSTRYRASFSSHFGIQTFVELNGLLLSWQRREDFGFAKIIVNRNVIDCLELKHRF